MFGIIMRIKMRFCLNKIEKLCFNDETGVISGDDINKLCSTPKKLKVLLGLMGITALCVSVKERGLRSMFWNALKYG